MKKELIHLIERAVDLEKFFITDIHIGKLNDTSMIKVSLDGDNGISVDDISEISRNLNKSIEESGLIEFYELEVTSHGVGEPLLLQRQYKNNIGRLIKVQTNDGKTVEGKLLSVNEKIVVESYAKLKHKIIETKEVEILISEIKKIIVLVSFN